MTSTIGHFDWPLYARPVVRVAGLFSLQAEGFNFVYQAPVHALHLHEYAGMIRIDGRDFALEPGTVTFSPADTDSSYDLPRPGVHWCIHFTPCKVLRNEPFVKLPMVRSLGAMQGEAVRRFGHIARLHACGGDTRIIAGATSVALQELLIWTGLLDSVAGRAAVSEDDPITRVMEFIDRRLHGRLTAVQLANHAGWSPRYLAVQFRRRVGLTLPRYILSRRVAAARLLLETTGLPVKQVALRVGMPDPHHFNKQFRLITGTSPSGCRDMRRGSTPADI